MNSVPEIRIRSINDGAVNPQQQYVLYWMTAYRRTHWNFSFQRAVEWSRELGKPLVVLEALRCGYRWANDRLHQFVIQGMADNARRLADTEVLYYPYLELEPNSGKGLLAAIADQACVVVGDDFPSFFLPRMMRVAAKQVAVRMELVDSNGILPMRAAEKVFLRAHDFRRFLQKNLRPHLNEFPDQDPIAGQRLAKLEKLPKAIRDQWPPANVEQWAGEPGRLAKLPIDHAVGTVDTPGGEAAAVKSLRRFLESRLPRYGDRNRPDEENASGLSPYLHFGHISSHQVFVELMDADDWSTENIAEKANGSSSGWWGASEAVEGFLDELITWREVGFNMCWQKDNYDQFESLPDWAQKTIREHADDERPTVYERADFEQASTHDELWNAAQRQLTREGGMHNYLRMLWGKKIYEWSETAEQALETMIELNNKYALDGRDPNSYSGIFWCLGRYDRAWGPERPIFGKLRYMTSDSTRRKFKVGPYLERYGPDAG